MDSTPPPTENAISGLFTYFSPMNRKAQALLILAISLMASLLLDVLLGSVAVPLADLWQVLTHPNEPSPAADILWHFRIPKAATAALAGSGLALAGLVMQTLFRNPLAGPDVLGLSAGAGLAVALAVMAGIQIGEIGLAWGLAATASVGSLSVFLLMVLFSRKMTDPVGLLILGLMVAAITSSIVSVLQFISQAEQLQSFVIWTMGSVGNTNPRELGVMMTVVLLALLIILSQLKALNVWLLGESYVGSLGIRVKSSRLWLVAGASLLTGAVTAFCGPIAFVGIAVPHLVRLVLPSAHHGWLIPGVMLGGATLLLVCDILVQLPGGSQYLPLNAMTALLGAPVVIMVVMKTKNVRW